MPLFIIATAWKHNLSEQENLDRMTELGIELRNRELDYGLCVRRYAGKEEASRLIMTKDLSDSQLQELIDLFLVKYEQECVLVASNTLKATLQFANEVMGIGALRIGARNRKPDCDHTLVAMPPRAMPEWDNIYLTSVNK